MTIATSAFVIRLMSPADIPRVAEIERVSFPTTWPPTAYHRELQNNLARYIVVVERTPPAEREQARKWPAGLLGSLLGQLRRERPVPPRPAERVIGFLGLWLMVDEAHIVTVAVRPDARRRGAGELLVAEALDIARECGARIVTLECRVSNTGAQALYEKYGFTRAGIRKRYYTDNGEDALIMVTPELNDPAYVALLEERRRGRGGLRTED